MYAWCRVILIITDTQDAFSSLNFHWEDVGTTLQRKRKKGSLIGTNG